MPKILEKFLSINQRRLDELKDTLQECRDFIDQYAFIDNDEDGLQVPNKAMRLVTLIDDTIRGVP